MREKKEEGGEGRFLTLTLKRRREGGRRDRREGGKEGRREGGRTYRSVAHSSASAF